MINQDIARDLHICVAELNKRLAEASDRGILSGLLIEGSEILEFACHGAQDLSVKLTRPKVTVEFFEHLLDREN